MNYQMELVLQEFNGIIKEMPSIADIRLGEG